MKKQLYAQRTYDEALVWLRNHGFELLDAPGTASHRMFLKKYGCSAAIERAPDGTCHIFAHPGILMGGEIAKVVDRGFQKFLKSSKLERAATADDLKALHKFSEELKEAMGTVSLYNEALGSVSESYMYDRVNGREADPQPKRPWDEKKKA
ncbi:MAG TPA: hypothetical protein VEG32_06285 [Clostridia bacterium]|nr:hypothetical protein [Clostridia bacterium]